MNDRRRPRTPAKPKPAPQLTGPIQLDDETRNALILFNARLVAQEELEREKRRVDKATKAKDEAAANVRRVESDPKATAEQKAEAQAAYRTALDALDRVKAGEVVAGDADATDESAASDDESAAATDAADTDDESAAATDEADTDDASAATSDEADTDEADTDETPVATDDATA